MNGFNRILAQHNLTTTAPDYAEQIYRLIERATILREYIEYHLVNQCRHPEECPLLLPWIALNELLSCLAIVGEGGAVWHALVELIEGLLEGVYERPYREGGC